LNELLGGKPMCKHSRQQENCTQNSQPKVDNNLVAVSLINTIPLAIQVKPKEIAKSCWERIV